MQKIIEIVVGKTLKRSLLNSSGRYYKLYLPKVKFQNKSAGQYCERYYFKCITQVRNYWPIFTNRQQIQRSYH